MYICHTCVHVCGTCVVLKPFLIRPTPLVSSLIDQSSNHSLQRSRIFACDAAANNVNVMRRAWLFLVAVIVVCDCLENL